LTESKLAPKACDWNDVADGRNSWVSGGGWQNEVGRLIKSIMLSLPPQRNGEIRPVTDGGMTWQMAEWHGGWQKQFTIDI